MVMQRAVIVGLLTLAGVSAPAVAQNRDFRVVDNPFQGEFEYRVNHEMEPLVEIDGVRWSRFAVLLRGDRALDPERENPVTIELDFQNTTSEKARMQVVILFEDADGNPLVRVNYSPFKIGGKRFLATDQKFKIAGPVLTETAKVYLFCEVQR